MHKDVSIVYITLMLLYLSDVTIQMKGRIQEELLDFLLLPKAQLQPSGFKLNFRLSARFSLNGMNNPQACFFMQMLLSIDLLMLTVQVLISTSC